MTNVEGLTNDRVDAFKQNVLGRSFRDQISFEYQVPSSFCFHNQSDMEVARRWFLAGGAHCEAQQVDNGPTTYYQVNVYDPWLFVRLSERGVDDVIRAYMLYELDRMKPWACPTQDGRLIIDCSAEENGTIDLMQLLERAQQAEILPEEGVRSKEALIYIESADAITRLKNLGYKPAEQAFKDNPHCTIVKGRAWRAVDALGAINTDPVTHATRPEHWLSGNIPYNTVLANIDDIQKLNAAQAKKENGNAK